MLIQRRAAMEAVVSELFPAEEATDIAIARTALLLKAMVEARQAANLAAEVGHDAIAHNISALVGLGEARRSIVQAHIELSQVKTRIGLGAVALGGSGDKPPASAQLEVVTTAA